jgi:hypothetical protein
MMGFYLMKYKCGNCLHGFMVEIQKGQEALINLPCPVCALNMVRTTEKEINWVSVYVLKNERLEKKA